MESARPAARAFSPLDEELQLLAGRLSPVLHEQLVRLSCWMPFAQAAQVLADMMRLPAIPESWARRHTEAAGAAMVLEADGAMVPLVGGEWTEAKTLIVATVGEAQRVDGELVYPLQAISSFSRSIAHDEFERLSLVETQRRGLDGAERVAAVADGAEWIQGLISYHRADAVRILDFPHAVEYLTALGSTVYAQPGAELTDWLTAQCQRLKHEGGQALLAALHCWSDSQPQPERRAEALAYLDKRCAQMAYPDFRAQGWPIGSGAVESANKLVVEARLKGAGMHWARTHVNPMLAMRNLVCSDRWAQDWPQIAQQLRCRARRSRPRALHPANVQPQAPLPVLTHATAEPDGEAQSAAATIRPVPNPKPAGTKRPAANHPWRRFKVGRARFKPDRPIADTKL